MNVKLRVLSAGVLFFMGNAIYAQETKKESESTKNIEEVIVVGYVKKTVSQVTGSSTVLKSSDIDSPSAISVEQALQGKVPGVTVNTTSGTPGAFQNVRIRGIGSLTASNAPLYVIDGVPVVSGNMTADAAGSAALSTLSSIASLNNDDIESIVVLKDAASTAVYGARGSNGVIVITTKGGKKGRTRFNFNSNLGFQNDAVFKYNMVSAQQKLELLQESIMNTFKIDQGAALAKIKNENIGFYNLWDGKDHNWVDLVRHKNAPTYTANLSATGGDDKSTFYTSLGYNKTEPTTIGKPFERITGMFNYKRKLTDRLNFEMNLTASWLKQNPILEGGSFFANPNYMKVRLSPWIAPYNPDGSYNLDTFSKMTSYANVLYTTENDVVWQKQMRSLANAKLEYKLLKNLTFSSRINVDYLMNDYKRYNNRYMGDGRSSNGYAERQIAQNYTWASVNQLNYVGKFDKHRLDVSAFFEYQKNQYDLLKGTGSNFPVDGLTNLDNASASFTANSSYTDWQNASYFGVLNYTYDNRFVLDATVRREGSSRFAPSKRYGTFWSVGGAWNLHKEEFMPKVFNELKLRSSYGLTGNSGVSLNAYQAMLNYDVQYDNQGGSYVANYGNNNLTWEKNKTFDVGVDFAILDSRVSGSVEYFNKYTYDLLQSVPLSLTTGFPSQAMNVGAMRNQGIEASLNVQIVRGQKFNWSMYGSVATLRNRVEKLALTPDGKPVDINAGSSYQSTQIGQSFYSWYMPTWAGVNTQTGAPEWYVNGVDGDRTSNYAQAQRVFQGTAIPKITGGFGTNISYENFFLNASFFYAAGNKIYDQYAQFSMQTIGSSGIGSTIVREDIMNRWQKPGDVTDVPMLNYNKSDNFQSVSSRHLYKGDYIRLKDITFGYNLSKDAVKAIGLDAVTLTVRGTNLWTYTFDRSLKFDPEVSVNGYSSVTTPPVKSIMFGVNLQF
ncbi:TonB-dependent Receptor Plug Domain protein [Elizabethkingia miricola]|nr:TonB-dependent Receptor Plug Domain protein [Elizabethkingia miricola]